MLRYTGGGLSCSSKHSALAFGIKALALILMALLTSLHTLYTMKLNTKNGQHVYLS